VDHLEKLERLLGFALQCLDDAAGEVRSSPELDTHICLKHVGAAIVSAWEIREIVHSVRPSLRPDFVASYAANREEFERYDEVVVSALRAELSGNQAQAVKFWKQLLSEGVPSHFRTQAQAGMYRSSVSSA
jgi:hypothetical protein